MKTQFYYALLDIGSEWRKIIKFIFQMLLSLLAFMYIVSSIFQQLGFSQWLQGKADYEHTYMLYDADTADVERFIPEGEERESLAQEFYRWIREDSGAVRTYSMFDYNLPIKDERLDASLSVGKDEGALLYYCASKSYGAIKNTVYAYYQKGYVATGEYGTVKGKKLNGCWVRLKEGNYDSGKVKEKSWPAAGSRYYRAEKSRANNPFQSCRLSYGWSYSK